MNNSNITLRVHCEADWLYYSDEVKVRQVLLNLLSNACKFTEKGSIDVMAGRIERAAQRGLKSRWSIPVLAFPQSRSKIVCGFLSGRSLGHPQVRRHGFGFGDQPRFCHLLAGKSRSKAACSKVDIYGFTPVQGVAQDMAVSA